MSTGRLLLPAQALDKHARIERVFGRKHALKVVEADLADYAEEFE